MGEGTISMGHARALVGLGTHQEIIACHQIIQDQGLSVRGTEKLVRNAKAALVDKPKKTEKKVSPEVKKVTERLERSLSTKVNFVKKGKGGRIQIEYASADDLNRLLDRLLEA